VLWGWWYWWRGCSYNVLVCRLQMIDGNSLVLAVVTDDCEKLGGTLVDFKRTIVGWLKGTPHYISTYKNVNAFGQVHTDVGLVLGIVRPAAEDRPQLGILDASEDRDGLLCSG